MQNNQSSPHDGVAIQWNNVVLKTITTKGTYGRKMCETWYRMTVMLQSLSDNHPAVLQQRIGNWL
jgi:hypothetical protein